MSELQQKPGESLADYIARIECKIDEVSVRPPVGSAVDVYYILRPFRTGATNAKIETD